MPKQKRRKRHVKRQWGKIDVAELSEAAQLKTKNELDGGEISKRPNEALFKIDKVKQTSAVVSRTERKAKARAFVPTLDKLIAPNPHTKVTTTIGTKKRKIGEADIKEVKRLQNKLAKVGNEDVSKAKQQKESNLIDVWAMEEEDPLADVKKKNPHLDPGFLVPLKPIIKKKPKSKQEAPIQIPAVELPKPGASYHPAYEDHQEVLQAALDEEMKRILEEKRFKQLMKREQYVKEIKDDAEGSSEDEDEDEEEAVGEEVDKEHVNVAFVDRKLKSQRNKEKRVRVAAMEAKKREEERALAKRMNRLEEYEKELVEREADLKQREQDREEKRKHEASRPKRLGPERLPKKQVEFTLTDELPSNLRNLKAQGNLLQERFSSIQNRGLVEFRKQKHYNRRYDQKEMVKFPHKDFVKEQEARYGSA